MLPAFETGPAAAALSAAFSALVGLTGAEAQETEDLFPAVPLPELGDGPITLRVVRSINPRFPSLNEDAIAESFEIAGLIILDQFGLQVRFERGDDYTLDDLLTLTPQAALEVAVNTFVEYSDPPDRLATALASLFANPRSETRSEAAFLEPYIPGAMAMTPQELAAAVADIWVQGTRAWLRLIAFDGEPVINAIPYHQHSIWSYVGYGELPFDIVITNQLIASAQLHAYSCHCLRRNDPR